jgi:hypothetical protein
LPPSQSHWITDDRRQRSKKKNAAPRLFKKPKKILGVKKTKLNAEKGIKREFVRWTCGNNVFYLPQIQEPAQNKQNNNNNNPHHPELALI